MKPTIHETIRTLRKQKHLSQQELAQRLGVSYQAVSKWERGLNLPDILLIPELCRILGISTDELLGLSSPRRLEGREHTGGDNQAPTDDE
jgi:tellurite methyltransferase